MPKIHQHFFLYYSGNFFAFLSRQPRPKIQPNHYIQGKLAVKQIQQTRSQSVQALQQQQLKRRYYFWYFTQAILQIFQRGPAQPNIHFQSHCKWNWTTKCAPAKKTFNSKEIYRIRAESKRSYEAGPTSLIW